MPQHHAAEATRRRAHAALIAAALAGCGVPGSGGLDAPRRAAPASDARATADRPDDDAGRQVHVYYVVPADGVDRQLDLDGTLARTVAAWNGWLAAQSGGPRLRLDTAGGALDITFVRLASTDAAIAGDGVYVRDRLERELRATGVLTAGKLAAVYYDGTSTVACGGGPWPPGLVGQVAALYLRGAPPGAPACDTNRFSPDGVAVGYLELALLHELFHALGAAPACAPHQTRSGHTSDGPTDLMYAGDEPWQPSALDLGRDDYWGHGRADCLDLATSAFVEPTPPAATLPPGW